MTAGPPPLLGRAVAVPESRHLDVLARLLEKQGAAVLRCPLIAIRDASDAAPIEAWIDRLSTHPPRVVVLYTGEGVNRLAAFAERAGRRERLVGALATSTTLTRGPKPRQALRALGLAPSLEATEPTTAGVMATLDSLQLAPGDRIAVQLYGSEPIPALVEYLGVRGLEADYVAPYVYASESDDARVVELIDRLAARTIDAITFTSQSQVDRLFDIAQRHERMAPLCEGLASCTVAAVGPVVAAALQERGVRVDVMPDKSFHMKPLVNALVAAFA